MPMKFTHTILSLAIVASAARCLVGCSDSQTVTSQPDAAVEDDSGSPNPATPPPDAAVEDDSGEPSPETDAGPDIRDAGLPQDGAPDAAEGKPPYRACDGLTLSSSDPWIYLAERCTHLKGDLTVRGFVTEPRKQQQLEQALKHVEKIDGKVVFAGNDALTSMEALRSLQSVGGVFAVAESPTLESLRGLSALTSVGGNFALSYLPALVSLEGLEALEQVSGSFMLVGLRRLPQLSPVSLDRASGMSIRDCPELETLHGLENVAVLDDMLEIKGNARLTSLSGLDGLTAVGDLTVRDNGHLGSLKGLEKLTRVEGAMVIENLAALESVKGLLSLRSVGGDLTISQNPSLRSLAGLEQLTALPGNLWVLNNRSLAQLTGLSALRNVGASLVFRDNPALANLVGLDALVRVGATLAIEENATLSSLEGAPSLTSVSRLSVAWNETLTKVSTLSGLRHAGSVRVVNNPVLSRCDVELLLAALDTETQSISLDGIRHDNCP